MTELSAFSVVHRATVHGTVIRFVRSPVAEVDAPWIVFGDALAAAGAGGLDRINLLRSARKAVQPRTAVIDDGIELILPPWALVDLITVAFGSAGEAIKAFTDAVRAAYPYLSSEDRVLRIAASPSINGGL